LIVDCNLLAGDGPVGADELRLDFSSLFDDDSLQRSARLPDANSTAATQQSSPASGPLSPRTPLSRCQSITQSFFVIDLQLNFSLLVSKSNFLK